MPFLHCDAGEIHYVTHGRGQPPLVFVHGLACALDDWRHQVSHFEPSRQVVCLDQRGHGQSRGYTSGFDMTTLGVDLAALLADLDLPPALLVGHSMGCRVVLECTRTSPEAVAGLVLIDGSRLASGNVASAHAATRDAIESSGHDAFFERLFTQMFTTSSDPTARDAIVARAKRMPEITSVALMLSMVAWDAECAEGALENLQVPLTVMQSTYMNENRERVSLRAGETVPWLDFIRDLATHADIQVVPGVGHFTMLEAPSAVNRHIEAMLKRIDAARESL